MARVATGVTPSAIVVAGVIGGLIFAVFEMLMAAMMMGPQAMFMPLRMIGGIVLGEAALDPAYSLITAGLVGLVVHMVLSIAFAAALAGIVNSLSSVGAAAAAGVVFGIALWIVNFYVVAPIFGWSWFPEGTNAVVQFAAHACFFGLPVAWILRQQQIVVAPPA